MTDEECLTHLLQASLGVQLPDIQSLAEEVLLREAIRIYRNLHRGAEPISIIYPYQGWDITLWNIVMNGRSSSIPERITTRMKTTAEIACGWFTARGDTKPPTFVPLEEWVANLAKERSDAQTQDYCRVS